MGTDHDTAAFAVATIERWWTAVGAATYPGATALLISADGGGSNASRSRLFKTELAALATRTGLPITLATLGDAPAVLTTKLHKLLISWVTKQSPSEVALASKAGK